MANPPPNQNIPPQEQEADGATSPRPTRRTRLNLELRLGPPGVRSSRYITRRPPPQMIVWPHLAARVTPLPPPPRMLRPRAPPLLPAVFVPPPNQKWKCPVCRTGFENMRSLSSHMRIHKDRGWRGLYPPPELCQSLPMSPLPLRWPQPQQWLGQQGQGLGRPLFRGASSGWMLPFSSMDGGLGSSSWALTPPRVSFQPSSSRDMGMGSSSGALAPLVPFQPSSSMDGGLGSSSWAQAPSVPFQNFNVNRDLSGNEQGGGDRDEERRRILGKWHAEPEQQTSQAAKRSKRSQDGQVPNLNDDWPPPQNREHDGKEDGGAGGASAV